MPKRGSDKLTAAGKKFFAEIKKLAGLQVQAGFTSDRRGHDQNHSSVEAEDYPDGVTVAEIAASNEFGTKNSDGTQRIPERPFMRQSVDNNKGTIATMGSEQLKAVVMGKADAEKALSVIGALQVGLIQHEIRAGGFTPNAPSTIKRKGSSQPLIDEGRMRQSVHYVVKERKG